MAGGATHVARTAIAWHRTGQFSAALWSLSESGQLGQSPARQQPLSGAISRLGSGRNIGLCCADLGDRPLLAKTLALGQRRRCDLVPRPGRQLSGLLYSWLVGLFFGVCF